MDKLIELLREAFPLDYDYVENDGHICHWYTDETGEYNRYWNIDSEIISKKFGFIKRLVDNDKIDLDKVEQEAMSWFDDESPVYGKDIRTARLIMMLSVDDRPIEFLISILK